MGIWSWFFKSGERAFKRGSRSQRQRRHNTIQNKSRRAAMKEDDRLRAEGIDPNLAICTECWESYDVTKPAQVARHAH